MLDTTSFFEKLFIDMEKDDLIEEIESDVEDKNSLVFDDKVKADLLQDQFSSVFTKEPLQNIPSFELRSQTKVRTVNIQAEEVEKKLKSLQILPKKPVNVLFDPTYVTYVQLSYVALYRLCTPIFCKEVCYFLFRTHISFFPVLWIKNAIISNLQIHIVRVRECSHIR